MCIYSARAKTTVSYRCNAVNHLGKLSAQ